MLNFALLKSIQIIDQSWILFIKTHLLVFFLLGPDCTSCFEAQILKLRHWLQVRIKNDSFIDEIVWNNILSHSCSPINIDMSSRFLDTVLSIIIFVINLWNSISDSWFENGFYFHVPIICSLKIKINSPRRPGKPSNLILFHFRIRIIVTYLFILIFLHFISLFLITLILYTRTISPVEGSPSTLILCTSFCKWTETRSCCYS